MSIYTNKSLYQALLGMEVIDKRKLDEAYKQSVKKKDSLSRILLEKNLISDDNLGRVISELLSVKLVKLKDANIGKEALGLIPEVVARKQKVIAFKIDDKGVHVAMHDPNDMQAREFIEKKTGLPVIQYYATSDDIEGALGLYEKDIGQAFKDILAESVAAAKKQKTADPPIIKIVDTLLSYAHRNKASDIHIEPIEKHTLVRFRIDGVLHDILKLPLSLHPRIITRVKVMSRLRTDEHQAAQDGKLQYKAEGEKFDVRVSIVPSTKGEKVVARLLSERARKLSLDDLGLNSTNLARVKEAYNKPHGMILATGPTGCGKTTTMYSIIKLLNKRSVNISTIEDPVEYDIEGITQIQVNPKTELTFAKGLRSIVRQDPDIILVGEVRDKETASIAVNSAMTGHLVLSTLHTNDAATAIPRLLDLGVEPFLIASSIQIIIAQRLVRKIHAPCKVSEEVSYETIAKQIGEVAAKKYFADKKVHRLYRGKGCQADTNTGYSGRIGIYEVLVVDDEIRAAIVAKKDADVIRSIAVINGMTTMIGDGNASVKQGVTTLEEIVRVTKE